MMSLSDEKNDPFAPMDIGSLKRYDREISMKADDADPDFDRFRLLFDPLEYDMAESTGFKELYSSEKEKKTDPFIPLVEEKKKPASDEVSGGRTMDQDPDPAVASDGPQGMQGTAPDGAEDEGAARGYDRGFETGRATGYEKGFAEGLAQGLAEGRLQGVAKGEAEGFASGEKRGLESGEAAARKAAENSLNTLIRSLEAVDTALTDLMDAHEQELLDLVFKIVQKVIHAQLDTRQELIRPVVMEALSALARPRKIELSVSPQDYEYIEMIQEEFFLAVDSLQHVSVRSDPLVPRGGCRIQTDTASVATDPDTRLDQVYDAVKAMAG
jgi:flagellar assembly protein FliH